MSSIFSSESVSEGHPDKLCDVISDSILDACLTLDPNARVAVETMVKGTEKKSFIFISGEITTSSEIEVDYEKIARIAAINIGYDDHDVGLDASSSDLCEVTVKITKQSPDISQGVDLGKGLHEGHGAGDQGLMFGFACDETDPYSSLQGVLMPLPIALSQRLTLAMTEGIKSGLIQWGRPDSKSQVTIEYGSDGKPKRADTIVVAIQHLDMLDSFENEHEEHNFIEAEITEKIVNKVIPEELIDKNTRILVNGTGRFVKGGPYADAGLTGRKIIVDTYGGTGRHGGGAFSGKDSSKVDRSAAYAARWAAKHVVHSSIAKRCEIQLAYAIGVSEPVSVDVNTFGTGTMPDSELKSIIMKIFDFRPHAIIENLGLRKPIYLSTASGGHFGREPQENGSFSWERINQEFIESLTL